MRLKWQFGDYVFWVFYKRLKNRFNFEAFERLNRGRGAPTRSTRPRHHKIVVCQQTTNSWDPRVAICGLQDGGLAMTDVD